MKKVLLVVVILLSGCVVTEKQFELAKQVCQDRGGVAYAWGRVFDGEIEAKCKDGTTITAEFKRKP